MAGMIFSRGASVSARLAVAILLSTALMIADHNDDRLRRMRAALSLAVLPIQALADLPARAVEWVSTTLASRASLLEENDSLHRRNLKLMARLQQFDALRAENMRLRDLLDSSYKIGDRVLIAELVGVDLDPFKQQILVDKGRRSNVFRGQPVLDADAVMGQVIQVDEVNSIVLLITDASHALPVQVLRNGLRGIAVGTGIIDRLKVPHLPNNADIRVGDRLVTSGLGGRFPPGYPVAEVVEVTHRPGESFAEVVARPLAHLDRVHEVLLVWSQEQAFETLTGKAAEEAADAASGTAR